MEMVKNWERLTRTIIRVIRLTELVAVGRRSFKMAAMDPEEKEVEEGGNPTTGTEAALSHHLLMAVAWDQTGEAREAKETMEAKGTKEAKEAKEAKETKEAKEKIPTAQAANSILIPGLSLTILMT